jgi:hypothetical protein
LKARASGFTRTYLKCTDNLALVTSLYGIVIWENGFPGLPDFSWYNMPKRGKTIPNTHKIYQIVTYYIR